MRSVVKALFIVFITSYFSACSKEENLNKLDDTLFVRYKNADMPAYIHGNGSEKVFLITLHGGPGSLGLGFRSSIFKNRIEKNYAVVYFDQRGSGMSQGNYTKNGISVDIMAEDVLALVKVIRHKYGNSSRFFLLGHSWGGTLGTAVLLKRQADFLGWIEIDGLHNPKGMYQEYISNFKRIATAQIKIGNSVNFWQGTVKLVNEVAPQYKQEDFFKMNRKAFRAEKKLTDDKVINKVRNNSNLLYNYNFVTALWSGGLTQSLLIDQGLLKDVSYTNRLSEIKIPSLILWGKHDVVVPPTFAHEAYDSLGSSTKKIVLFEKSGHEPMFSEGNQFADELILFMDTNK